MSQFSKGPWQIEGNIEYQAGTYLFVPGHSIMETQEGYTVAVTIEDVPELEGQVGEANARLVVSAPELYDALKEAVDLFPHDDSDLVESWQRILNYIDGEGV